MKKIRLSPARLIALGFLAVILVGAGLLTLPIASPDGASFLDALFTSTSATCVTGLIVRDTFTGWTTFGQVVILLLIQLGGLGFMTVITLVSFALGKKLGLYDRKVLMQSAGSITFSGIGPLIRHVVPFSFGFDLMGARAPFSSLTAYAGDPLVTLTISALIVIGGLGFVVWRDLVHCRFRFSKLQLHTRLVLTVTGILIGGGWLLFLLFERNAVLAGLRPGEKALSALFLAVTPRTAGFNTVDMAQLSESGNLLTNVLMLIGGSPGSTAGGIKTTTVAVLLLSTFASGRGSTRVHAFRYSIDRDTIRQANSILLTYLSMSTAAILAICCLDPVPLKAVMFEVNSAIATVGLSLGVTPALSAPSHIILILLMYAGRIGGLTFVLLFAQRRSDPPLDRPSGKLLIG